MRLTEPERWMCAHSWRQKSASWIMLAVFKHPLLRLCSDCRKPTLRSQAMLIGDNSVSFLTREVDQGGRMNELWCRLELKFIRIPIGWITSAMQFMAI